MTSEQGRECARKTHRWSERTLERLSLGRFLALFGTVVAGAGLGSAALASARLDAAIDRLHEEMTLRALARDDLTLPDRGTFAIAIKAHCRLLETRSPKSALRAERMAWVDYSRPSTEKRLYLFDLERGELLHQTYATHGVGSVPRVELSIKEGAGDQARSLSLIRYVRSRETRFFSNRAGSNQSSVGAAIAEAQPYFSTTFHSLALRMNGVDPALNSNLLPRAVVFHAWGYTGEMARMGYLPSSQGCLMFPSSDTFEGASDVDVNRLMIAELERVPVYLYHPRLVDQALNEREYAADLLDYESLKEGLASRIEEEGLQARRRELETALERQWLKRAVETRAYFERGSKFIGREPEDESRCLSRLGYMPHSGLESRP
jgi:hypothetical protein